MTSRRISITAALAALLFTLSACGTAQPNSTQPSVVLGTAVSVERSTQLTGLTAGEDEAERIEECGQTIDAGAWPAVGPSDISDALAERCDYRLSGDPCEEDELCAVQQVRDTGDFSR